MPHTKTRIVCVLSTSAFFPPANDEICRAFFSFGVLIKVSAHVFLPIIKLNFDTIFIWFDLCRIQLRTVFLCSILKLPFPI